jgi:hypothetical protein
MPHRCEGDCSFSGVLDEDSLCSHYGQQVCRELSSKRRRFTATRSAASGRHALSSRTVHHEHKAECTAAALQLTGLRAISSAVAGALHSSVGTLSSLGDTS